MEQPATKNHNTSADNWELAKKEGWWLRNNLQISWNLALCLQKTWPS